MFTLTKQGAVSVISGDAPLNAEHLPGVAKLIDQCLTSGQPRIVFHLQQVPLIDSAGLELLSDTRNRCAQRGGTLELAAPGALCRDILTATRLTERFAIFDDLLAAVGSFAQ